MSAGACAKKKLCDPPARAAIETADGIVDLLDRAMRDGEMSEDEGDALIYAYVEVEERFMAEMKEVALQAVEALERTKGKIKVGRTR